MKFKLFLLAAFVSTAMFAQVKPKVTSAVLAFDKSDFANAKLRIDQFKASTQLYGEFRYISKYKTNFFGCQH